jgi:hypothetical protein
MGAFTCCAVQLLALAYAPSYVTSLAHCSVRHQHTAQAQSSYVCTWYCLVVLVLLSLTTVVSCSVVSLHICACTVKPQQHTALLKMLAAVTVLSSTSWSSSSHICLRCVNMRSVTLGRGQSFRLSTTRTLRKPLGFFCDAAMRAAWAACASLAEQVHRIPMEWLWHRKQQR